MNKRNKKAFSDSISRRNALKRLVWISGGAVVTMTSGWSLGPGIARAKDSEKRFIVEGLGQKDGYSIMDLTRKVFDAAGGISRFISRGDVVALKPNLSWARQPDLAATTNPELLKSVAQLCYDAGAKKVRIVDNTIHDARRCFAITEAGKVAKESNADLVFPRSALMKDMKIQGRRLDVWPVFVPMVEADKLINMPIAKHHSLSSLTIGMKNWIGGVGGRRSALHQDIHQTVVDLAQFFQPTLTLVDAIKILVRNGPSGGSPADVEVKNMLILSNDQVAADARAAMLFGYQPQELSFIRLAREQGLGTYDFHELDHRQVML
ncbi:MAG: DUF362 domain-containing protein [Deltaproteobacteria bacterium]|nr:DUF362 domain-containing protein [Deltaproteobacteria bacterium]